MFEPARLTLDELSTYYPLPVTEANGRDATTTALAPANDNGPIKLSTPDSALALELIEEALDAIPNGLHIGYEDFCRIALMVRGACLDTHFEDGGRDAFLTWAASYPKSNPREDMKMWRSARRTYMGWRHLLAYLEQANPAAAAQIAHRAAQLAFGAGAAPAGGKQRQSLEDRMQALIERMLGDRWSIFRSPEDRLFVERGNKIYCLTSEADLDELGGILFRDYKQSLSGNSRKVLRDLLAQRAAGGEVHPVYIRTGSPDNSTIYWDLADGQDRIVEVTATGWRIIARADCRIKFERRRGMQPLPLPIAATSPMPFTDRIALHMNIPAVANPNSSGDPGVQARVGLVCAATAYFRSKGTKPLVLLAGPMGTGKTRAATRLKALLDPDVPLSTPSLGTDERDLLLQAKSQLMLVLDNTSSIKPTHSDVFCSILDGTGHSSRALYTNGDRFVMTAHCGLVLTSIRDELITREDLLDRTIRVELEPLTGKRTVEDLDQQWASDLPHMMAEFLDLMVAGLAGLEAVKAATNPSRLPRLIDMALFAEAALRGTGWTPGLSIDALLAARNSNVQDNLVQNPVAVAIAAVVKDADFEGTMEELRTRAIALGFGGDVLYNPSRFQTAVTRVIPQLTLWGISHTRNPRTAHARTFRLTKDRGMTSK